MHGKIFRVSVANKKNSILISFLIAKGFVLFKNIWNKKAAYPFG